MPIYLKSIFGFMHKLRWLGTRLAIFFLVVVITGVVPLTISYFVSDGLSIAGIRLPDLPVLCTWYISIHAFMLLSILIIETQDIVLGGIYWICIIITTFAIALFVQWIVSFILTSLGYQVVIPLSVAWVGEIFLIFLLGCITYKEDSDTIFGLRL